MKKKKNRSKRLPRALQRSSSSKRRKILYLFSSFLFLLLFSFIIFQIESTQNEHYDYNLKEGDVATTDIFADRDILYVDQELTAKREEIAISSVIPVYVENSNLLEKKLASLYELKKLVAEQNIDLKTLYNGISVSTYEDKLKLIDTVPPLLEKIYSIGILSDEPLKSTVEIWRISDDFYIKQNVSRNNIFNIVTLAEKLTDFLEIEGYSSSLQNDIRILLLNLLEPNYIFDEGKTNIKEIQAIEAVEPIKKQVKQGELILSKGVVVNSEAIAKIEALRDSLPVFNFMSYIRYLFIIITIALLSYKLFNKPFLKKRLSDQEAIFLTVLITLYNIIILILNIYISSAQLLFGALLPTATFMMLITLFAGARVGIITALISSLTVLGLSSITLFTFIFILLSSIISVILIQKARTNTHIIKASFLLAFASFLINMILSLLQNASFESTLLTGLIGGVNGLISGILTLGIRPFLDYFLNVPTPLRLMELSDLSKPIFKRMITRAAGTYNHSIAVANLAESAAMEIGADPLLARVGGYYHDIGKIDQPEYYIENQGQHNKHEDLKPSMSAAVIKSHVKLGIEKARDLKLPQAVVDIVAQHHGNSIISYFYEEAKKEDKSVNPADFSYNEHPPISREAAIVMIADSSEAAVRSLKNPTFNKIDKIVWSIMLDKMHDKQLSYCDLSFKDYETIRVVFVNILKGYYHQRIEYPNQKEKDESN